jgi:hypothetical protein
VLAQHATIAKTERNNTSQSSPNSSCRGSPVLCLLEYFTCNLSQHVASCCHYLSLLLFLQNHPLVNPRTHSKNDLGSVSIVSLKHASLHSLHIDHSKATCQHNQVSLFVLELNNQGPLRSSILLGLCLISSAQHTTCHTYLATGQSNIRC